MGSVGRLCNRLLSNLSRSGSVLCSPSGSSSSQQPSSSTTTSNKFHALLSRPSLLAGRNYCSSADDQRIELTFVCDGVEHKTYGKIGDSLLDVVFDRDIPLDGFGACEGTVACSTCHCVFTKADYDALPEKPIEEELDMLDLAYGLTDTSRLGCQIELTKAMNGLVVEVPAGKSDARG